MLTFFLYLPKSLVTEILATFLSCKFKVELEIIFGKRYFDSAMLHSITELGDKILEESLCNVRYIVATL